MIDVIEFHDALRFAGIVEDVPFHGTDSRHELKLQKALAELDLPDRGAIADLEYQVGELERDLRREEQDRETAESEARELKRELNRIEDSKVSA